MKPRTRIYVAGCYSSDNVLGVFENMRKGMRLSVKTLLAGFAPFCPWLDYHFSLMLRGTEKITVADYYEYSMSWLYVSDAMLLVPGWEKSVGTSKELTLASEVGIPVFYTLEELVEWEKSR